MLVDREGLRFRVLAARYGVERGRLCVGGMRGSAWWREIVRIRDGGGEERGGWFREHITKKVGDESDTFFWTDPWIVGSPLRERFGQLFELAENNSASVAEMFSLGWGAEKGRRGSGDHSSDIWQWQPDLDDGYTVRGAYHLLTEQEAVPLDAVAGLIWHSQVPLKVSVLAWRLLRDQLPTKANLISRGILPSAAHLCVSGYGERRLFLIILSSSLVPQEGLELVVHLCNSYDLLACELCGQNEITYCSKVQQILYFICWIRSRLFLIGG
ncbi:hypothetical protein TSUD_126220 [Trifolium subterraneum]|uniref:Reverse transcriptase zinc-binding domain-containing protein n=1 Tax=Trifolium subterraneum TaxID=3900 RepID=A0A2Z6M6C0_TRISU|nr:hypothetical protein TSUD_126220 [Trifolium subterraneum]